MKRDLIFFRCSVCGNFLCAFDFAGPVPVCCGKEMEREEIRDTELMHEKHLPQLFGNGGHIRVKVGEIHHPMTSEHRIEWIILITNAGAHLKDMRRERVPETDFLLSNGERPTAVYAYCNLHGLWRREV